jgi:hypothetical protein
MLASYRSRDHLRPAASAKLHCTDALTSSQNHPQPHSPIPNPPQPYPKKLLHITAHGTEYSITTSCYFLNNYPLFSAFTDHDNTETVSRISHLVINDFLRGTHYCTFHVLSYLKHGLRSTNPMSSDVARRPGSRTSSSM